MCQCHKVPDFTDHYMLCYKWNTVEIGIIYTEYYVVGLNKYTDSIYFLLGKQFCKYEMKRWMADEYLLQDFGHTPRKYSNT